MYEEKIKIEIELNNLRKQLYEKEALEQRLVEVTMLLETTEADRNKLSMDLQNLKKCYDPQSEMLTDYLTRIKKIGDENK